MKIEKLTENKIRVVMNFDDMNLNSNDLHAFFNNAVDSKTIFLDILEKAEKDFNFHTDGCKLLIEAFSTLEDSIVFTITKFSSSETTLDTPRKRKLVVKRKNTTPNLKTSIYKFEDFNIFCDFCKSLSFLSNFNINKLAKKIILYKYKDFFYLIVKDINLNHEYINKFFSILSEFARLENYSMIFENKLIEHGKVFVKNNAISSGIKFFI